MHLSPRGNSGDQAAAAAGPFSLLHRVVQNFAWMITDWPATQLVGQLVGQLVALKGSTGEFGASNVSCSVFFTPRLPFQFHVRLFGRLLTCAFMM